jgi:hypothetical protein
MQQRKEPDAEEQMARRERLEIDNGQSDEMQRQADVYMKALEKEYLGFSAEIDAYYV